MMSTDTTEKGLEAHISQYLHDENKEDFSAMMFGVVKELINRGIQVKDPYA